MNSRQAIRPPGLRTRFTSARTASVSGMCIRTAWQWATSNESSSKGKVRDVADVECGVGMAAGGRGGLGQIDLRGLHVNAVKLPGLHRRGQADGNGAWTAAKVEHAHAGPEVGQQVCGVGGGTAAVEELAKLLAVAHGVAGGGRRLVRHVRALLSEAVVAQR